MTDTFVTKVDSNSTGLRVCEEDSTKPIGTLPATTKQIWYAMEPNSYQDFGAATKTKPRMPINPSRQLQKGTLVDMDPAGGFQNDLTQDGLNRAMQGFFFANFRESFDTAGFNTTASVVSAAVAASHKVELATATDLANVLANEIVSLSGFTNSSNNSIFVVASETSTAASGTFADVTTNPTTGETVTIGTRVYTFKTALTPADGEVLIGASASATVTNLGHAINGTGGTPGTDYYVTAADPLVTDTDNGTGTLTLTAIVKGYGGNSIVLATTDTNGTVSGATLTGGVGDLVFTSGIADEASPPSAARAEVVGYEGASGDLTITNSGTSFPVMGSTTLNFTTLPLIPGQWVYIGGDAAGTSFATAVDNGWARIHSIAAHALTFDKTSSEMVTDAGTGKTVQFFWGKVLKNEYDPAYQKRRSYTFERTLGKPDLTQPTKVQAEYVHGAVSNELTVNFATASLVNADLTFLGTDYTTIDVTGTPLSQVAGASAPTLASEDAYNTTSEVARSKMAILSTTDGAPTALYAEVTELKVVIKNNLKANKSIGKLGPFELTAGFFEASGTVQAYFNEVAAVQAIRDNADVTIDLALAHNNKGVLFDLPLMALQSKGLDVKINEPIMIPVDMTLGADRTFNHTLLVEVFDYLPTAAMPA